jgi:hypothetical protein
VEASDGHQRLEYGRFPNMTATVGITVMLTRSSRMRRCARHQSFPYSGSGYGSSSITSKVAGRFVCEINS